MVAFGKDKLISISLSEEEQLGILQHCQELPPRIHRRIKIATDGTIYLMRASWFNFNPPAKIPKSMA